ncbi:MAG: tetratricopeptide repeat protein [Candidatus Krumholzibacteriia bacterium]
MRRTDRTAPFRRPRWEIALLIVLAATVVPTAAPPTAGAAPAMAAAGPTGAAPAAATEPAPAWRERSELLTAFGERMRAADLDGAAATARLLVERFPADGDLAYNLACVEARRGETAAAWTALERALASPLADPRQAERDADLASLRGDPRFARLLADARDRLRARAAAAAVVLRDGYPSGEFPLLPDDGSPPDADWPTVTVRLEANGAGLTVRGQVVDSHFRDRRQPWRNGDGFRVTFVVPPAQGGSGFDGDRSFGFGFGLQDRRGIGALVETDGIATPIEVLGLAPKVRLAPDGRTAFYTMQVPWASLAPYAPPVDTLLGVNISYLSVGNDRVRRVAALVPDPALLGDGSPPWRRYAPVTLRPSDRSLPRLGGAVANAVVTDAALDISLAAWLPRPLTATVRVEILDVADRSVVASGGDDVTVAATAGLNTWQRRADLTPLPSGPFRVRATLAAAGLDTLHWQTEVLRLDPAWTGTARAAAAKAVPAERPSLDYRLDAIDAELASREPRTLPSRLTATLLETGRLLQRLERTGTVLPDSGLFLAAWRDAAGALRPCPVRLPSGFSRSRPHRLLLLASGRGSDAGRAALGVIDRLGPVGDLVAAAPELPDAAPTAPATDAAAALRWLRELAPPRETCLAGFDAGAADALALSLTLPGLCDRVLLIVGTGVEPWSGSTPPALAAALRARPNTLPYTVLDLGTDAAPPATSPAPGPGQPAAAREIAGLLRAAGLRVEEASGAPGAPSLQEIANRLTAWLGAGR